LRPQSADLLHSLRNGDRIVRRVDDGASANGRYGAWAGIAAGAAEGPLRVL